LALFKGYSVLSEEALDLMDECARFGRRQTYCPMNAVQFETKDLLSGAKTPIPFVLLLL